MRAIDITDDAFFNTITISDDYMFRQVFGTDKKLAAQLLETVLEREVGEVEYVHSQHEERTHWDAKATVFDVYLRTSDGSLGNVEMQTTHKKSLPLRLRAHLSNIDRDAIRRGQKFDSTRETTVVVVCTFDPVGDDLRRYTVKRTIQETNKVYDDRQTILLLNAVGTKGKTSPELDAFLRYVAGYDKGENSKSAFVREVHKRVCKNRADWRWREGFMTLEEKLDMRFQDGLEQGLEQGGFNMLAKLISSGIISKEDAAAQLGVSAEELDQLLASSEA